MDWRGFISQYDLVYETPPTCWQDGMVLGNGSLGAVFFAPEQLEWLGNKTDVIDARTLSVKRVIPPEQAAKMVRDGASVADFEHEERGRPAPEGMGPKTCFRLAMDLGMSQGMAYRTAMPSIDTRLSLFDATLKLQLDKHLCHPRVESFVHADRDVMVIRVSDVSPIVSFHTNIFFSRPEDIELPKPILTTDRGRLIMCMEIPESGSYVAGMQIVPRASRAYREDVLLGMREQYRPPEVDDVQARIIGGYGIATVGGDFDLFTTVVTSRDSDDPLAEMHRRLDDAAASDYADVRSAHDGWWEEFWKKSWVELGHKSMEQLFYHSLYTLGSSYNRAPVPGLLGLCYGHSIGPIQMTPWWGDLHHDLNVQCPFFPVHALNHSELFDAYIDTYESFLPEARRLAKEVWGVSGAHFDMCFNAHGKSIFGGVGHYRFYFGGSYVALMHCLCWRLRRDIDQLRDRIYPFLKEVLEFYVNMMAKGDDGRCHMWPAHACELDIMDTSDPVQVVSMLRVCLETALEASLLLGMDHDLAETWRELLDHLPEYPLDEDRQGRMVVLDGAGVPAEHHVGQAGCLHPVYPCGEFDEFSGPEILDLYNRTLDSVVDKTAQISYANDQGHHYQCIWQCFFRGMTALRLGRVDEFWNVYMPMLLRTYSKPNGLMSHDAALVAESSDTEANLASIPDRTLLDVGEEMPVFEPWCGTYGSASPNTRCKELSVALVEGSADYLTMIVETLMQSHNGVIRVFPGWPKDRDAQFVDLIAEGNIAVSSKITSGNVEFVKLRNQQKCSVTVKVKSPWTGEVESWELALGEELMLTRDGLTESLSKQSPLAFESARPRVIYNDANGPLWIGRPTRR